MSSPGRQADAAAFTRAHATTSAALPSTADMVIEEARTDAGVEGARPLAPARWDCSKVRRVLVVRLRSIGDTVLATPSLHALRRFLPGARGARRSEEHTSELQSHSFISYA